MKLLLLNQFFYPDLAPTAQLATELAEDLVAAGIEVTAVAGQGSYLGGERLPARQSYRGISIHRLPATSLGKRSLLHRGIDYASFYASAAWAMATLPRHDVVMALSTPPLIAAAGLIAKWFKSSRLVYWVQDLYPEVAVAFGALRPHSPFTTAMRAVSRQVLRRADRVVVLGEAMAKRVCVAGALPGRVVVVPNWADSRVLQPVAHEENPLRPELTQGARLLVMYSGNFGRAHDVATLIEAARLLRERSDIAFLFVGDGTRRGELERAAAELPNLRLYPYQLRERLAQLLSAADVHLVSLASEVEGLLEPSKLYGVMAVARPALFVGPAVSEVARTLERERCGQVFGNGDAAGLATAVRNLADQYPVAARMGLRGREALVARYDRAIAVKSLQEMIASL